jgi:hypothetical protein
MRRRDVLRAGAGLVGAGVGATALGSGATGDETGAYEPLGFVAVEGTKEAVVEGTTAYVATTDGIAVVDVADPENPTVLAERRELLADRDGGPLPDIWDVKVDGDTLLAVGPANGGESLRGVAVFDVSDPTAPALSGFHETQYPIHNAFLSDGVAYLTGNDGDRNPLVTVDVGSLAELGRWSLVDANAAYSDVDAGLRTVHDLYVNGDRAYLAHWDAGTWILDVSDPAAPAYVGATFQQNASQLADAPANEGLQLPGNAHYVAVDDAGELMAVGREAWDADPADDHRGGPGGVDLYDVTERAPRHLATVAAPTTPDPGYGGVWTTAHNLDIDGDRLYTAWYRGGVKIHDVSDPANPRELAWWRRPDEAAFWTARRGPECVVAASYQTRTGVFTFPDGAGEQPNPPSLTSTTTTTPTTGTLPARSRTTDTRVSATTAPEPAATARTTRATTATTTRESTETLPPATTAAEATTAPTSTSAAGGTGTGTTGNDGASGLGVGAGAVALVAAAWRRWRR